MSLQYVTEYVSDLESKFDFLVRILFEKFMKSDLKITDISGEFDRLPFSLQQQYGYLWENSEQVAAVSENPREYLIKMAAGIDFMNTRTLVEYMLELYADNVEIKYMKTFFTDMQRKLSKISVPEFEGTLVSLPLLSYATLTLELDSIWYHRSMEDLMKFQRAFPFRNWYFLKVMVVDSTVQVLYGVQRKMRLYQVELGVLRTHGVVQVKQDNRLLAKCSPQFKLKSDTAVNPIYNDFSDKAEKFKISPEPGISGLKMSLDRLSSEKHRKSLFKPCSVYSKQPIQGNTVFEVEVALNSVDPATNIIIGLYRVYKGRKIVKSVSLLPYECNGYCVWHEGTIWDNLSLVHTARPYGKVHLADLSPKSRVALTVDCQGDLTFYVDGVCQGLAAVNVYDSTFDVYATLTMLEGCQSIRIVKAKTEKECIPKS